VPNGECTRFDCQDNSECSVDGGSSCFGLSGGGSACFKMCQTSGAGQSTCRQGFVCQAYQLADGGRSADGVCDPACNVPGASACPTGTTCNTMGYCM